MKKKANKGIDQNTIIQGDVILRRVAVLPDGVKEVKDKILQQSEVTGHHHYFVDDSTVKIYDKGVETNKGGTITPDTGKFLIVDNVVHLYHGIPARKGDVPKPGTGDHAPVAIPEGIWEVIITRQYDYDRNEVSRVVD